MIQIDFAKSRIMNYDSFIVEHTDIVGYASETLVNNILFVLCL